jgi:hypothetical protein
MHNSMPLIKEKSSDQSLKNPCNISDCQLLILNNDISPNISIHKRAVSKVIINATYKYFNPKTF